MSELWCEKHDHLKRSCPWCEIKKLEREIKRLKQENGLLQKTVYVTYPRMITERDAALLEAKRESERLQTENERMRRALEKIANAYERELLDYPDALNECVEIASQSLSTQEGKDEY